MIHQKLNIDPLLVILKCSNVVDLFCCCCCLLLLFFVVVVVVVVFVVFSFSN